MRHVRAMGMAMAQMADTRLGAAVGVVEAARPVAVGSAGMVIVTVLVMLPVIEWWTVVVLTPVMVVSWSEVTVAVMVDSTSGVFARGLPGMASQGLNLRNSRQRALGRRSVSAVGGGGAASILYETSTWGSSVVRLFIAAVLLA